MNLVERATALWRKTRSVLAGEAEAPSDDPDSSTWPTVEAQIYSSEARVRGRREVGVEMWYEYHAEGEHWSGSHWIPFPDMRSAEAYADAHPPGLKSQVLFLSGQCWPFRYAGIDQRDL